MEKDYQKLCICKMCPTYIECGELVAFCLPEFGTSKCITVESGCVCPGCPVYAEKGFVNNYHCIPGHEEIIA